MDDGELFELTWGKPPLPGGASLADQEEVWREVWRIGRCEALEHWISRHPATRPPVWHKFDAPTLPKRKARESEPAWLYRIKAMSAAELKALHEQVARLARFNEGRHPADPGTNFIHPGPGAELLRSLKRLSAFEVTALWPPKRPQKAQQAKVDVSPVKPVKRPAERILAPPVASPAPAPVPESAPVMVEPHVAESIPALSPPPLVSLVTPEPVWVDPAWTDFISSLAS